MNYNQESTSFVIDFDATMNQSNEVMDKIISDDEFEQLMLDALLEAFDSLTLEEQMSIILGALEYLPTAQMTAEDDLADLLTEIKKVYSDELKMLSGIHERVSPNPAFLQAGLSEDMMNI